MSLEADQIECIRIALRNWYSRSPESQHIPDELCDLALKGLSAEAKHDEPRWQKVPKYWRPTAHAYVVHPAGCKGIYTSVGSERYFLDIHQMGVDQSEYVNYSSKEQE